MKVVVAGLAPRDEVAFGIFLGRSMKTWSWERATVVRGTGLPVTDVVVLDLAASGLAHGSPSALAELSKILSDMPAVLLVSAHNLSWSTMPINAENQPRRVLLSKPYGTQDMRLALEKVLPSGASPVNEAPARDRLVAPPPPPAAASIGVDPVIGLSAAELQSRLADLPSMKGYVFLRNLAKMLSRQHPFEVRFTVQNSVMVHPADGWIASNTPMQVVQQVCRSDNLASVVEMREIDSTQAEERVHLLGMSLSELDLFLAELWDVAQGKNPGSRSIGKPH